MEVSRSTMPRLSLHARERVKTLMMQGKSINDIVQVLQQKEISVCQQTVWRFQKHYLEHHCIAPLQRSDRPTKLTECVLQAIERAMQDDDETTAAELGLLLQQMGVLVLHTRF